MVLNNYIIECFLSLIPSFLPIIILISRNNRRSLTFIALLVSCLVFIASILLIVQLVPAINTYQLYGIIDSSQRWFFPLYAVDNLGSLFLVLTTFIMPFSILYLSNSIYILYKEYILLLLIIEFFLINLFLITDLFWFYIMFESLLFPFFILIGAFGYRRRRNHAAYQFLFYTIFGSIFFLAGTIYLYSKVGCTDFRLLTEISLYWPHQLILWFLSFLALFIKVPVMPAHIWLPEAHVEAPTVGSVILASLILKISFYGFLRILLPIFPNICIFMEPLIICLCTSSFLWASIISLRQTDLKKIIAYSSVVHMNFTLIGLLLLTTYGICGSLISCISHGFISGALFFCSGMLYDRYNTRNLIYFGGLSKILPLFSVIFFIFIIGNFGFPGFISFIGEILIIFSMPIKSVIFTIILASGLIFSTVYTMWIYDHIFNGSIKIISSYSDLNRLEFWLLLPLLITSLLFGIYPIVILDRLVFSVEVLTILI